MSKWTNIGLNINPLNFMTITEYKQLCKKDVLKIGQDITEDYNQDYNEILKCYNGVDDIHASTSFEFGLMNDLYYSLFYCTDYED